MSTIIYNHYHKELDCDVAHVDDRGIVYSDPVHEAGYSCGHLGDGGRVYSHPVSKAGYCLGHVDENGKIYDHPTSKAGHCVGHVDADGVVYSHSNDELGYEVGHVKGPHYMQAGAYYLLAMYGAKSNTAEAPVTPSVSSGSSSSGSSGSGSSSTGGGKGGSTGSSVGGGGGGIPIPAVDVGEGGNCFGMLFMLGLAIALGLIKTVLNLVINYPIFILFYIYMAKGLLSPSSRRKVNDFKVSEEERQRCKDDAMSNLPKHVILPVILTIYSLIKNQPFDSGKLIPMLAPAVLVIFYGYFQKYMDNLYNAEKASNGKATKKAPAEKKVESKPEAKTVTAPVVKKTAEVKKPIAEKKESVKAKTVEVKPTNKSIVECPDCGAKLRVPVARGNSKFKVKLKCPKCNKEIITNI